MTEKLKVDWASYEAAKFACKNWHYSGSVPAGKLVKIGAWENGKFIGVLIFSHGSNNNIGRPYGLTQQEVCELTRVALCSHQTFVSEILAKAIKMLKMFCPGLRLIVSYADAEQHHHGGIYQAANWIYLGKTDSHVYFMLHGKKIHSRSIHGRGYKHSITWLKKYVNADYEERNGLPKYKYLMPLDKKMRRLLLPLAKPYPKKEVKSGD